MVDGGVDRGLGILMPGAPPEAPPEAEAPPEEAPEARMKRFQLRFQLRFPRVFNICSIRFHLGQILRLDVEEKQISWDVKEEKTLVHQRARPHPLLWTVWCCEHHPPGRASEAQMNGLTEEPQPKP